MDRHSVPDHLRSGVLISTPIDSDRVVSVDTVSCCHCGRVWVWQPGSGRRRGFCLRCNGFICGNARCDVCVPQEQQLENLEAGRPADYRPILVSVPGPFPRG